uniref:Uncharacterized protein n=1 Tax=Anguilla anguilla TaxID=7936 RepID=A0A0E9RM43_ANGAN
MCPIVGVPDCLSFLHPSVLLSSALSVSFPFRRSPPR